MSELWDGLIKDFEGAFKVIKDEEQLARRIRELTSSRSVDLSKLKTEDGELPVLHLACLSGNPVAVTVLLKKFDASVDILTKAGKNQETAFHMAAVGGDIKVLAILLDQLRYKSPSSANPNVLDMGNKYGRTPLHLALESGRVEAARFLIRSSANVRAEDSNGFKILHYAARSGDVKALELVWETEVDVNATSNFGLTPLHWAAAYGLLGAVDWLLKHGANMTITDRIPRCGWLPLHYAGQRLNIEVVEKLLCQEGTNPFATTKEGKTVLDMVRDEDKSSAKVWLKNLLEKMQVLKNIFLSEHMVEYVARHGSSSTCNWLQRKLARQYLCEKSTELVKKVRLLKCAAESGNAGAVQDLVHLIRTLLSEHEFLDQLREALQKAILNGNLDFAKGLALELREEEKVNLGAWVRKLKLMFLEQISPKHLKELWTDLEQSQQADEHSGKLWGWGDKRYKCKEEELGQKLPFAFVLAWIRTMQHKSLAEATAEFIEHQGLWDTIGLSNNQTKKNALHWAVLLVKPTIVDELLKIKACEAEAVATDENDKTPHELAVVGYRLFTLAAERAPNEDPDEKKKFTSVAKELENIRIKLQVESQAVKDLNDVLHRDRTLSVEALNAILVGSALLAGITFQGVLQQPTTSDKTGLNIFAAFNSLSFFFGMASAVIGATGVLPKRDEYIGHLLKDLKSKLTLAAGLLIISITFVLVAFASAGVGTIHRSFRHVILITIGIGGSLCVYMLSVFMTRLYLLWWVTEREKDSGMQKLMKKVGIDQQDGSCVKIYMFYVWYCVKILLASENTYINRFFISPSTLELEMQCHHVSSVSLD